MTDKPEVTNENAKVVEIRKRHDALRALASRDGFRLSYEECWQAYLDRAFLLPLAERAVAPSRTTEGSVT